MDRIMALYEKKQMKFVKFGLLIAFIGAMFNSIFQNFNVAATGQISGDFETGILATFVLSVTMVGICEFIGGIICLIWNVVRGVPLAEIPRTMSVKSGRLVIVSGLLAGPIGTACSVIAISNCGSTYANCIIGLCPAVTAVLSVPILKEKISARAAIGIIVSVSGALIACLGDPGDTKNFMLGILIACICPIAFALEGIISTHAIDVTDPMLACPIYRMVIVGACEILIVVLICAASGNLAWLSILFDLITGTPLCMLFMLCTAICMCIQYNTAYTSYTYCGAAKGQAITWTGTFWTIPVGFTMQACGILPYSINFMGIIGAVVVVVGTILVVCKPSELFNLRSH